MSEEHQRLLETIAGGQSLFISTLASVLGQLDTLPQEDRTANLVVSAVERLLESYGQYLDKTPAEVDEARSLLSLLLEAMAALGRSN